RDRYVARQEPEVRDDVTHLGAVARERRAVHAAAEAVVDPILDRFHCRAAWSILRIAGEHPHPGAALTTAVVQVAADAAELVSNVTGQAVTRGGQQRTTPPDRGTQRSARNERVGGSAQRGRRKRRGRRGRTTQRERPGRQGEGPQG